MQTQSTPIYINTLPAQVYLNLKEKMYQYLLQFSL
jgi:hypothetical protein